jgi:hypothetical protein
VGHEDVVGRDELVAQFGEIGRLVRHGGCSLAGVGGAVCGVVPRCDVDVEWQ